MIGVSSIVLTISCLFVSGSAQYYGYPYNYGNQRNSYPVSSQPYPYRSSPCQSSCNSHCQYLPCYSSYQQLYYQQSYNQQPYYQQSYYQQPYYQSYSRQYASPYYNSYNSQKSSDPYANVPVEIIDDNSGRRQTLPYYFNRRDEYANVPTEIIDDDGSANFWKTIPILPKSRTSSSSNYTVTKGEVITNSTTHSNPLKAVITRSFEPLKKQPDVKIDFYSGVQNNKNQTEEDTNEIAVTVSEEEETTTIATETNEVGEKESEEVSGINSWFS